MSFWPYRDHEESNYDPDRNFNESMQGNDPRGICSRNQNNDRQGDTGISISGFLQPKAIGEQADENDRDKECDQIRSKVMRFDRSDRRAQGRRDYAFDGERQ